MTLLWLIGLMGTGKTTAGRRASEILGVAFIDTDQLVEERAGMSVPDIWELGGEQLFREHERAAIAGMEGHTGIVATGGGAVLYPTSRDAMRRSGHVIWLEAAPEIIAGRITAGGRPLLLREDALELTLRELLERRREAYASAATERIDTGALDVEGVAAEIATRWPV
jgi:shikimate kinase